MRTIMVLWAATTLTLASTTLYFAHELHVERARHDADVAAAKRVSLASLGRFAHPVSDSPVAATPATPPASPPATQKASASSQTAGASRTSGAPAASSTSAADKKSASGIPPEELERMQRERERRRKQLADPATRALIIEQAKVEMRLRNPGLAAALHLTPEEEEKLIALLTRQRIEMEERSLNRGPDESADFSDLFHQQQSQIDELLGYEKAQRYAKYQLTMPEREQLRALRARLDDANTLREDQASRLMDAMYDERNRYVEELMRQPDASGYGLSYPIVAMSKDRSPAGRLAFEEAQMPRTEAFQKTLHDRAAALLTPEQLRRFDQLQEAQLVRVRGALIRLREEAASGSNSTP